MLAAAATAASPLLARPEHRWLLLAIGACGVVVLGAGLATRWSSALVMAIALLGVEQAVRLAMGPNGADPWAPLYAGALLLTAELAWWSIERRVPAWAEGEAVLRRLATLAGVCTLGSGLAALVVLAAGAPLEGGVVLELVGVVAATASLAVVAALARTRVG